MAKRAIQNPERFIATVERNLAEYSHDIALILDKSWEASDAISDGLSQLLGISLLYSGKGTPRRDLVWVLNSAVRTPDRNLLQPAAAFPNFRFPCFLKFSSRQLEYFNTLLAEKTGAEELFKELTAVDRGELTLANVFLCGVAGDWRKAERLAKAAAQLDTRSSRELSRTDYPLREEAVYFRAVAVRHSPFSTIPRWIEAVNALRPIVEKKYKKIDLRYFVEYAVLGISVPYHAYYYDLKYSEIFHPDPASALVLFREAARRFENEYQNDLLP